MIRKEPSALEDEDDSLLYKIAENALDPVQQTSKDAIVESVAAGSDRPIEEDSERANDANSLPQNNEGAVSDSDIEEVVRNESTESGDDSGNDMDHSNFEKL